MVEYLPRMCEVLASGPASDGNSCNPSTQDEEVAVQGQPWLDGELEVGLVCI